MFQCQFTLDNGSQCNSDVIDFICQHCSNKFCLTHLIEHAYDLSPINM